MEEIVFSASPFQVYLWSFVMVLFLSLLGMGGLLMGLLRRSDKTLARLGMGCSGAFLGLVAIAIGFNAFRVITGDTVTITARLEDKFIATDNCGDGGTCTRYVMEMRSGSNYYDLQVDDTVYQKMEIQACYSVTYYPEQGLFSEPSKNNSYQYISSIIRIERRESSTC